MANLNQVFMMGNITRDPELRRTPTGTAVTTLGLAVNSTWGRGEDKKEETLFIDVNIWGKVAENCVTYLKKGAPVFIEGRLRTRSWDDKESGKKITKMEISASKVHFLPRGTAAPKEEKRDDIPPQDDDLPF